MEEWTRGCPRAIARPRQTTTTTRRAMKKILLMTTSLCLASSAFAGGYRVSIQGQQALGMGHAATAMSDSAETVFFNPGAITRIGDGETITGGLTLLKSKTIYQNSNTTYYAETDSPIGTPINFYYVSKPADSDVAVGLGIYTPYGNVVKWPTDWSGSHLVNDIELKALYIQPTIAVAVNGRLSIGFGPTYAVGKVNFNRNLNSSLVDSQGNRSDVTVEANDVNAWGYNLGLMFQASDRFAIGLGYRSRITLKARGEKAMFSDIPRLLRTVYPDTTFDADLILPAELALGVSWMISSSTTLAIDYNRTYWGDYKALDIQFHNGAGESRNPRNWQDSDIYRIGVQHRLGNTWTLRAGIYLDKTPIQDGYFAPETPRNDATGYTLGASLKVNDQMDIDMSFLYITSKEFNASYDHHPDGPFGGLYKSSATSIGLGFNYRF